MITMGRKKPLDMHIAGVYGPLYPASYYNEYIGIVHEKCLLCFRTVAKQKYE